MTDTAQPTGSPGALRPFTSLARVSALDMPAVSDWLALPQVTGTPGRLQQSQRGEQQSKRAAGGWELHEWRRQGWSEGCRDA